MGLVLASCASAPAARPRSLPARVAPPPAAPGAPSSARGANTTSWTRYHRFGNGSGAGPAGLVLAGARARWTSPVLDGTLYGEPLVWRRLVYVATERDTVYALSASSGRVVWARHLATPVPASSLPCGNITPTVGITGTPVVDPARSEIFAVADELLGGAVHHVLYGIDASNGQVELRQRVDPPQADPRALLQRTGLALDGGRVVFGFGGNDGDCSTYHGWVESVPVTGGRPALYEVDRGPGELRGAVWMGGAAPVVLGNGDVVVAVGNGSVTSPSHPYDFGNSVLELSSSLRRLQYFAPRQWAAQNATDEDLGSAAPAVLGNGLIVQAGKSEIAYLLDGRRFGGIGGQLRLETGICGADVDGGPAFSGDRVYLPCRNGVMEIVASAQGDSLRVVWQTGSGAGGPPILAGGLVWSIGHGVLYGLSPTSGRVRERLRVGPNANDFPTPSVGDGLLLATSERRVHAYAGS